jgi:hypothetical protein
LLAKDEWLIVSSAKHFTIRSVVVVAVSDSSTGATTTTTITTATVVTEVVWSRPSDFSGVGYRYDEMKRGQKK